MSNSKTSLSGCKRQGQVTGRARSRALLLLALGLALLLSLWLQVPRILDPLTYQEDFAKFFWMHSYADPELFSTNRNQIPTTVKQLELGSLSLNVDATSPAYSLLMYLGSTLFPIILFNKLLLFPLMMLSVYFLFRIGEKIRGPGTGFALALAFAVINLNSRSSVSLAAGLQRSFAIPMLIVLIYTLILEKYWVAVLVIFISGLFYPPVMLLGLITYTLSLLEPTDNRWPFKVNWRKAIPLAALLGIAIVLTLPAILVQLQRIDLSSFGQADQIGSFLRDPQYSPEGRYSLFRDQSLVLLVGRGGLFSKAETFWQALSLAFLAMGLFIQRPKSWFETHVTLKRLVAASFIAYALAWLAALATSSFLLYLPNRYLRASLPLVFLIFVVTNFETSTIAAWTRFRLLKNRQRVFVLLITGLSFLAVIYSVGEESFRFFSTIRLSMFRWPFALAFAFLLGSAVLKILTRRGSRDEGDVVRYRIPSWSWSVTGLVLFVLAGGFYVRPAFHDYESVSQSDQKRLNYLQGLPKEALIVGGPCLVDDVPLLAKRSVLWSCEQPGGQQLVVDTLEAYYAVSMADVLEFCQKYNTDYMLINQESFELERVRAGRFFKEPYNSLISPQIINRTDFALQNIPEPMRIFESDGITIIPCKPASVHTGTEGLNLIWSYPDPWKITTISNLNIALGWEVNGRIATNQGLSLKMLDSEGRAVQQQRYPLFQDNLVDDSTIEDIVFEDYSLSISPYLLNGTYTIVAAVVPIDEQGGLGEQFVIGQAVLDKPQRVFASQENLVASNWESSWDNKIALIDFTTSGPTGDSWEIGLSWLALQRMTDSYKVFAHLINSDTGELVLQEDAVPRNWSYPTNWWEKNEIVMDTLNLQLSDLEPGHYQLWLGLYDEETFIRLPRDQESTPENPAYTGAIKLADFEY